MPAGAGINGSILAQSSVDFLNKIVKGFPFPVQRIQTDRGPEFFAYEFQDRLRDLHIKFRPNRPAYPQLNGKVERSQRTDLDEFYQTVDLDAPDLAERLKVWETYYNRERPHSSLGNRTPWEKWLELADTVPTPQQVYANFDVTKEQTQSINYATEYGSAPRASYDQTASVIPATPIRSLATGRFGSA